MIIQANGKQATCQRRTVPLGNTWLIAWRQETDRGKCVLAFDLKHRSQLPAQVEAFVKSQMPCIPAVCHLQGRLVKPCNRAPVALAPKFQTYLRNIAWCIIALTKCYFPQYKHKRMSVLHSAPLIALWCPYRHTNPNRYRRAKPTRLHTPSSNISDTHEDLNGANNIPFR